MRRLRPLLFLLVLAPALAACGRESVEPARVEWRTSKPTPGVGAVKAAVTERPSADRAFIEARWANLGSAPNCELELILPEGVVLLEGERRRGLMGQGTSGEGAWLVQFPSDRGPLDAVVRFCASTDEGLRSCEASVRLVD